MKLAITTNSPGEVAAWVRPFMAALLRHRPQATVTVFVVPCTFASGTELEVVRKIPGVEKAIGPREFLRFMFFGLGRRRFASSYDAVLFLGGDQLWAAWLGRRFGCPALAYTEGQAHFIRYYARFLVPDQGGQAAVLRRGVPAEKIAVVGNLMFDAVSPRYQPDEVHEGLGLDRGRPVLALFPGSRPHELELTVPFFLAAAALTASRVPELQLVLSRSPFVPAETLTDMVRDARAELKSSGRCSQIPEVRIVSGLQYDVMLAADLALTIPGSNTLEMAHLGLPMIVAVPLNEPEKIPLEGPAGLIDRVPFIGRRLKRKAVLKYAARIEHASLPNRLAGEQIVPELVGRLEPGQVAELAVELLEDPGRRAEISRRLQAVAGGSGAAERILDEILKVCQQ